MKTREYKEQMMTTLIARLIKDDEGQDLIEYALIGGLVALGAVAALTALSTDLKGLFDKVAEKLRTLPIGGAPAA